jgi:fermentation-respiration switch protein FrsA (DUF1100 family)
MTRGDRDLITATSVQFSSDGETVAATLYGPSDRAPVARVVFSGPMTSVKEQSAGVYARALARRGFAALAFDHRHFGASQGRPRQLEDPTRKVEDIRSAITALEAMPGLEGLPVMGLGLCAGGGYMARATAEDDRIRAFTGVVGAYVQPAALRHAMGEGFDAMQARGDAAQQRWEDTGVAETIPAVGPGGADVAMPAAEAYDYYGTDRGGVPTYVNQFAVQSWAAFTRFDALGSAPHISVPTLVVHAERAALPELAHRFHADLAGPRSELWLDGADQVSFYDRPDLVDPTSWTSPSQPRPSTSGQPSDVPGPAVRRPLGS